MERCVQLLDQAETIKDLTNDHWWPQPEECQGTIYTDSSLRRSSCCLHYPCPPRSVEHPVRAWFCLLMSLYVGATYLCRTDSQSGSLRGGWVRVPRPAVAKILQISDLRCYRFHLRVCHGSVWRGGNTKRSDKKSDKRSDSSAASRTKEGSK